MLKDAYAQVYLAQGDLDKAEISLNEAIALFQQMRSYRLGEAILWEAKATFAELGLKRLENEAVKTSNVSKTFEVSPSPSDTFDLSDGFFQNGCAL